MPDSRVTSKEEEYVSLIVQRVRTQEGEVKDVGELLGRLAAPDYTKLRCAARFCQGQFWFSGPTRKGKPEIVGPAVTAELAHTQASPRANAEEAW